MQGLVIRSVLEYVLALLSLRRAVYLLGRSSAQAATMPGTGLWVQNDQMCCGHDFGLKSVVYPPGTPSLRLSEWCDVFGVMLLSNCSALRKSVAAMLLCGMLIIQAWRC